MICQSLASLSLDPPMVRVLPIEDLDLVDPGARRPPVHHRSAGSTS
jgi:hypothetical protein